MNKKIVLTAFIITCLFLSHQASAKGLHFGIISAIEKKIHELKEEVRYKSSTLTRDEI